MAKSRGDYNNLSGLRSQLRDVMDSKTFDRHHALIAALKAMRLPEFLSSEGTAGAVPSKWEFKEALVSRKGDRWLKTIEDQDFDTKPVDPKWGLPIQSVRSVIDAKQMTDSDYISKTVFLENGDRDPRLAMFFTNDELSILPLTKTPSVKPQKVGHRPTNRRGLATAGVYQWSNRKDQITLFDLSGNHKPHDLATVPFFYQCRISRNGQRLFVQRRSGLTAYRIADLRKAKDLKDVKAIAKAPVVGQMRPWEISHNGKWLTWVSSKDGAIVWNVDKGKREWVFKTKRQRTVATINNNGQLFTVTTKELLAVINDDGQPKIVRRRPMHGYVGRLTLSPSQDRIAISEMYRRRRIVTTAVLDADNFNRIQVFNMENAAPSIRGTIQDLSWSKNGRLLLTRTLRTAVVFEVK